MKDITSLIYVTGNQLKFSGAETFFKEHAIELIQQKLDTYEIQGFDSTEITVSKALQAWDILKKPLFVNDTSWDIPALGGFPGPYMKYVNDWFSAQDFLNLMQDKPDRSIVMRDTIVYIDEHGSQIFTHDITGAILETAYKGSCLHPSDTVICLTDDGKSLAEIYSTEERFLLSGEEVVWEKFASWLKKD
jgi:non-canonical purine NTP pyrophosphatase (RdgB/HAM1 family)